MDNSNKNEQPLLVVHYVWWRVLWRLFIPYVPCVFIFYGFGGYFIKQGNPIAYITMYSFMLFSLAMAINILFTKDFRFYKDRMEKRWFLFGTVVVNYSETVAGIITVNMKIFNQRAFVFEKRFKYRTTTIELDQNLISEETNQNIFKCLAEVSNRDISEFVVNVPLSPFIKPFIKPSQQGA